MEANQEAEKQAPQMMVDQSQEEVVVGAKEDVAYLKSIIAKQVEETNEALQERENLIEKLQGVIMELEEL